MKTLGIFLGFFLVGMIIGLGYFLLRRSSPVDIPLQKSSIPQTNFSIADAPKNSIRGMIATFSGQVFWQSRVATESSPLEKMGTVQQGEKYATGDNGQIMINFSDFGSFSLQPKSEVSVVQTLPVDFVFNQASGSATYTNTGQSPFSIRTLHLLTTIASGSASVDVDYKKHLITLFLKDNLATVAYNDVNYNSHVVNLDPKSTFVFDDDQRIGKNL